MGANVIREDIDFSMYMALTEAAHKLIAYLRFLGQHLTDKVPDASAPSQNRRRRFAGAGIEQEIFDAILEAALPSPGGDSPVQRPGSRA